LRRSGPADELQLPGHSPCDREHDEDRECDSASAEKSASPTRSTAARSNVEQFIELLLELNPFEPDLLIARDHLVE